MIRMDHEKTNSVSWAKLGQAQCSSHQVQTAQLAGLLAHSAGSAGRQLNSAGWSVVSLNQCVSSGRLPGRLVAKDGYGPVGSSDQAMGMGNPCGIFLDMSRSRLTVPGCLVTAIGEGVALEHTQLAREEEGWPDSTSYGQDSLKERGAREGSFMGVRNDPVMVIDHGLSRPRLPMCLGNTRKGIMAVHDREGTRSYTIMYKSVGSYLIALNHGLDRFRNDAHGLSRAVHDQDPYGPGRFIGI
ncbi:hypothetical protein F2Q68_00040181 [Brassica cretica]|uniref:Uncharacterized protein n=1 Tax=Brassica cretica TaxID=69181 RepID=A0A8S9ML61_BRACR|nr:hypothetical protein F2Q68_00040181 [Brassica cretica]